MPYSGLNRPGESGLAGAVHTGSPQVVRMTLTRSPGGCVQVVGGGVTRRRGRVA
jgi:hypothetical protein